MGNVNRQNRERPCERPAASGLSPVYRWLFGLMRHAACGL